MVRRFSLIFLQLLMLAIPTFAQGDLTVGTTVSVNGGPPFRCESIVPGGKTHLEITTLAARLGLKATENSAGVVFAGKLVKETQRYQGKTYVDVQALATALGYTVKDREQGLVVDFWTIAATTKKLNDRTLSVSIFRREKLPSATPGCDQIGLVLDIKNNSDGLLELKATDFNIIDEDKRQIPCLTNLEIPLKPGERRRLDVIYFDVPSRAQLKSLTIQAENKEILGRSSL